MKVVFMGTPDFSVGALEAILAAGHEVTAVVCQPDKPKGRSNEPKPCPVKECALARGLEVFQPQRIRRPEAVEKLRRYPADIFVVAAFGQILPQEILDMPRYGCVNIHASLLPKYRGATPIQQAILNGDEKSGVTIMQMDAGIDTGDILLQKEITLSEDETGGSLFERLSVCGAELIVTALQKIEEGSIEPRKQDESQASHVGMLTKEDGRINWLRSAEEIERMIRGLDPWPGAYTFLERKQLKIWKGKVISGSVDENRASHPAGCISRVEQNGFSVSCGKGELFITELQLEGKKRMPAEDFLRGMRLQVGEHLG
ncbi:MAG: methionyl-tRNA formyltransferase [Lachnospiraceae bacterium]|nr:methionyl-tRNA formyltransferase [Lachnospiraceae bacterium]